MIKLGAVTDETAEFFGEEWVKELINLGIDFYFQEKFKVVEVVTDLWFVFVPVKMDGELFGVWFPINDIVEYEATGDMRVFWKKPKLTFMEDK